MIFTKEEIWCVYKAQNYKVNETAKILIEVHGSYNVPELKPLKVKLKRILVDNKPCRIVNLDAWMKVKKKHRLLFMLLLLHMHQLQPLTKLMKREKAGRPKVRLSNKPTKRTAKSIIQPEIYEWLEFADEQGITYEEVLEMLQEKKATNRKGYAVFFFKSIATDHGTN